MNHYSALRGIPQSHNQRRLVLEVAGKPTERAVLEIPLGEIVVSPSRLRKPTPAKIEAIAGSQGRIHSDGRAVNYLPYNYGGYPTNKLRLTIKHPVGVAQRFQAYIEHFV